MNTLIHVDDTVFALNKGLFTKPNPEHFGIEWSVDGKTFKAFGEKIGLPENIISSRLDKFCTIHELTDKLIDNSFLSEELKKRYKIMYKSRINSYLCLM